MACGCNNQEKPIAVQHIKDVTVDALTDLPQYLLAIRDTADPMSGDTVETLVKLPTGRVLPNGTQDNVFALTANNEELDVPAKQVRAGRVQNLGSSYAVNYDDAENPARFIILGTEADSALCISTGVANLLAGHEYIINQDYYASADGTGEPTTDPASGIRLFAPISRTQLLIDVREV